MEERGRRTNPRVKARLKVRFKDASAFISEYTHNISKGGMFVRTGKPSEVGSIIEVILVLPESGREIIANGKVIHLVPPEQASKSQPAGMGLKLSGIAAADQRLIDDFIKEKIKSGKSIGPLGRRQHERFEAKIRVRFGSMEALLEEYAHNISHGGIFIRTKSPKKINDKLKLILTHPRTKEEIYLEGEVVRTVQADESVRTRQPAGMGIRFLSMDDYTKGQLEAFINSSAVTNSRKSKTGKK